MVEKELGAQAVGHSTSSLKRTMLLPTETYAFLALNIATIIWGSQHAVLKNIVKTSSPAAVNAVRFSIAAALAAPWLPWNAHCHGARATWLAGAELGGWMFCGFSLQVYGLQFTSASRSAFFTVPECQARPNLCAPSLRAAGEPYFCDMCASRVGRECHCPQGRPLG